VASLYFASSLASVAPGSQVALDGAEGRHAVTVARVRAGESLRLADGTGRVVTGIVASVGKDSLTLTVDDVVDEQAPSPRLVLVQALAKGGRDEMAVQAATEIGVDGIVPWQAARSVSRWDGPKVAKGVARWQAIAHEAAKQSIRARVPVVSDPVTTAQLAAGAAGAGAGAGGGLEAVPALVVLDPTASVRLAQWAPEPDVTEIALVVGPEGGIDGSELDRLSAAGAVRVRLGDTVLRTSTAGPAALAVLQASLGRW
jgi:16S rRNA (uracil1498-N3)-methyltransferase